jgi:hypothetical protein
MIHNKTKSQVISLGSEEFVDVKVSNTELEALLGTPKSLIDVLDNEFLIFTGAVLYKPANSDAQTVPGNAEFAIRYTDINGLQVAEAETTGFMDQTTEQVRVVYPFRAASGNSAIVPVAGSPLVLSVLNANMSAGDAVLKVRCFFKRSPVQIGAGL